LFLISGRFVASLLLPLAVIAGGACRGALGAAAMAVWATDEEAGPFAKNHIRVACRADSLVTPLASIPAGFGVLPIRLDSIHDRRDRGDTLISISSLSQELSGKTDDDDPDEYGKVLRPGLSRLARRDLPKMLAARGVIADSALPEGTSASLEVWLSRNAVSVRDRGLFNNEEVRGIVVMDLAVVDSGSRQLWFRTLIGEGKVRAENLAAETDDYGRAFSRAWCDLIRTAGPVLDSAGFFRAVAGEAEAGEAGGL
jgi:hypothetical protein